MANQCAWTTDGRRCTAATDALVCSACADEKNDLLAKYKAAERRVVSALSSPEVRGDATEALKVITRLQEAIAGRQAFTARLAPVTRDAGHEYRVTTLYLLLQRYRRHLQKLAAETSRIVEEDEALDVPAPAPAWQTVQEQITVCETAVAEDPFAPYDEVIRSQKSIAEAAAARLTSFGQKLAMTPEATSYWLYFIARILLFTDLINQYGQNHSLYEVLIAKFYVTEMPDALMDNWMNRLTHNVLREWREMVMAGGRGPYEMRAGYGESGVIFLFRGPDADWCRELLVVKLPEGDRPYGFCFDDDEQVRQLLIDAVPTTEATVAMRAIMKMKARD